MSDISWSSDEFDCDDGGYGGEFMDDRYVVIRRLGMGAFAQVWLAYDIKTNNYYAIKIHGSDDTNFAYGEIELDVLEKIKKVSVPYTNMYVHDFVWERDDDEHFCIVYELLAGNLHDILRTDNFRNGLPFNIVKKILVQVLTALASLHEKCQYIHADVKVENILYEGKNSEVSDIIDKFEGYDFIKVLKEAKKKSKYRSQNVSVLAAKLARKIVDDLNDQLGSSDSSDSSDSDDEHINIKDGVNINDVIDIVVRLSDFGTCEPIKNKGKEIQCRHYRAPEVIIGYPYNEKCDIWSIGCVTYELITGELLFDPNKTKALNRDKHHLVDIYSLLGPLPNFMVDRAQRRQILFRKNGLIKSVHYINPQSMKDLLAEKLINYSHGYTQTDMDGLISFLNSTLTLDPAKRPSAAECLAHPFMN
jgi:serine/threonine-protein kinase SRPK3